MDPNNEFPVIRKPWKKGQSRVAIVFPNLYRGGAYCFGQLIFYNLINNLDGWSCERRFLDYDSLEHFDLIGFTFQYELDYFNFLKIIKNNKISLEKKNRKEALFAGGPCVTTNPMTLSEYFDFLLLGDAEATMIKVLEAYKEKIPLGKSKFLEAIADIEGVFVPGISVKESFGKVVLDEAPHPFYQPLPVKDEKNLAFGKAFMLEIERSCPYSCNFCSIPQMYSKFQCRSLETIKTIVDAGVRLNQRKKIVIYSPSFMHPRRKELMEWLIDKGLTFSVPSLRVEYATEDLFPLIKKGGQKTLTIAPECNESLRYTLGKKIKDGVFFTFLENAKKHNFKKVKMYLLVGLPGQSEKDLDEMIEFIKGAKKRFPQVYLSVNSFVAKPRTKLADHAFDKTTIKSQLKMLKREFPETRIKTSDLENSHMEWKLSHATSLGRFLKET